MTENYDDRFIMLPVNEATGEVDYMYIEYDLKTIEETEQYSTIDGWEFKKFKIVPAI